MSESVTVSVQGPQGQPVQKEDPLCLPKLQKQLNMQNTSIDTLTVCVCVCVCGGGGRSYIMDVRQGFSNPYPVQTKISAKFWTLRRQMVENFRKYIPPKARK